MIRALEASLTVNLGTGASAVYGSPHAYVERRMGSNPMQSGSGVIVDRHRRPRQGEGHDRPDGCFPRLQRHPRLDDAVGRQRGEVPLELRASEHARPSPRRISTRRGFSPDALSKIYHWYASNFAYLLQQLDSVKEGDDYAPRQQPGVLGLRDPDPDDHGQTNMPFVIAGKAQGIDQDRPLVEDRDRNRTTTCSSRFSTSSAAPIRPLAIPKYNTGALTGSLDDDASSGEAHRLHFACRIRDVRDCSDDGSGGTTKPGSGGSSAGYDHDDGMRRIRPPVPLWGWR